MRRVDGDRTAVWSCAGEGLGRRMAIAEPAATDEVPPSWSW